MNETDTTAVVTGEADFDDVEAHGIKEVMVGLSAAAVLTGGVAAVMSSDSGAGSSGRASISTDAAGTDISGADLASVRTSATGVDATAMRAATTATDGQSTSVLGTKATSVGSTVDDADDVQAPSFLGSRLDRTDSLIDSTVDWSREVRDNSLDTARETVHDTRSTVRNAPETALDSVREVRDAAVQVPTVSGIRNQVRETVTSTTDAATGAAESTIVLAGDLVRGVEGTATTTIARVQPSVGSDLDASTATGWVTVSIGGEEIARAELRNGEASLSYTAPSTDAPILIAFSGNDLLRGTSITL